MFDFDKLLQHWANRVAIALRIEAQRRMKAQGINLSAEEWALLMVLWRNGPTAMSGLADVTLKDRTTVTRLADRLVAKGYIERRVPEDDKRSIVVAVTRDGEALKPRVLAVMMPLIEASAAGIAPEDLDTTVATLKRVFANIEADKTSAKH